MHYQGLVLQIPPQRHRHHYVRAEVRVHEHSDASLAIFEGLRRLARYHSTGALLDVDDQAA